MKTPRVTVSLSPEVLQKARILAAIRSTSVSGLLAEQIEAIVRADEAYERASASAISRLQRGFHLGDGRMANRDQLHERRAPHS